MLKDDGLAPSKGTEKPRSNCARHTNKRALRIRFVKKEHPPGVFRTTLHPGRAYCCNVDETRLPYFALTRGFERIACAGAMPLLR